jgi:hypothetical protein
MPWESTTQTRYGGNRDDKGERRKIENKREQRQAKERAQSK